MELSEARELAKDMCKRKGCDGWADCCANDMFIVCSDYNQEVKEIMEDEDRALAEQMTREGFCDGCKKCGICNEENICDGFQKEVKRSLKEDF